jgi:preprotein translocase subunit Sec61beta
MEIDPREALALCAAFGIGVFAIHEMRRFAKQLTIALVVVAGFLAIGVMLALDSRVDIGASARILPIEADALGGF